MRLLTFILALAVAGCSGDMNPCARITCSNGGVCDPSNGRCVPKDAGTSVDAGRDAGTDAGPADAGFDAGVVDGGSRCSPPCGLGSRCDETNARCVQCLSDNDCSCPAYACVNNSCLTPAPSDAGVQAPAPAESCASALPFTFRGCTLPRSATFRVNLGGRSDDEQGVCSAAGNLGRDVVYVLSLEATYDLEVTVTPVAGSSAEPVVYVRRMPCGGQELVCSDSGGPVSNRVYLRSRTQGSYAIILDTFEAATAGEVEVTLTLRAPTQPANDTCQAAEPLPADGGHPVIDLSIAADDEFTACNRNSLGGRDVAYVFDVPTASDIVARVTALDADAGVEPVVEIREGGCGAGTSRGCATARNGVANLRLRAADAGTYYVVVESKDPVPAGRVEVAVALEQPLSYDTCNAPRTLVIPDGGFLIVDDIDTRSASDDEVGSCNDPDLGFPGGPEYIYHLRLPGPRRVTVTAQRSGNSPADAVIYMREGSCIDAAAEIGCADDYFSTLSDGGTATEILSSGNNLLPAGDYYVFVESWGGSSGPTQLTVSVTP